MTDDGKEQPETVGALAELYLGNILYSLERCALALAEEGKSADAAFYRGIGRLLADAHGKNRLAQSEQRAD